MIVRIEDLVVHDPIISSKSAEAAACVMATVDISAKADDLIQELEIFHGYRHEYMGHSTNTSRRLMTPEIRQDLEAEFALYTGTPHEVMQALGYNVSHYGLTE